MEDTLVLKAEKRDTTGTKSAVKVRKAGRIPGIVYGHKKESIAVSFDAHSLVRSLHHGSRLFDIQIDKKKDKVLLKDIQYDYLGKEIIHLDLIRVDVSELVKVTVPIELKGIAKGTTEGGIVEEHLNHLEIECKVTDMPDAIVVLVKDIDVGDTIHAGDVELPEGVVLITPSTQVMVTCSLVAAAKSTEELEEEVPAAPEVIGDVKEEGSEEGPSK
jgi:large subunit ribosomal protein L25